MASHTMRNQAPTHQRRTSLAFGPRAMVAMTLVSTLLAGCSGTMERQTTAQGPTGGGDAQTLDGQTDRFETDPQKADPATGSNDYHADTFICLSRPIDSRVRNLRTPWEARRYLMPDGTLSAPPGSETPR